MLSKYLAYALGEIILVVVGILIALQINNWNEKRNADAEMITNILSIMEDIRLDLKEMDRAELLFKGQGKAGKDIIPLIESDHKSIKDSLQFILEFNDFTTVVNLAEHNNTFDHLHSSGRLSQFPDKNLLKMIQYYYSEYDHVSKGIDEGATPSRLEIRKLKYELFPDKEHRKFFPTSQPKIPDKEIYSIILTDKRIPPLVRYITSTANYFEIRIFETKVLANEVLSYIEKKYNSERTD